MMSNAEFNRWMKWELGVAGSALVVLLGTWAVNITPTRWLLLPLVIVALGEMTRDQVILNKRK